MLTEEQRQKLKNAGYSDSKITAFEAQKAARMPKAPKSNIGEKILDVTGGKEIAQGIGQSLAMKKSAEGLDQAQNDSIDIQSKLIQKIKEKKSKGEDTSQLEEVMGDLGVDISRIGNDTENILNPNQLTGKQVIGDALQLATTIGGVGTYGKAASGMTSFARGKALPSAISGITKATSFGKGVLQGAKVGAISGSGYGALSGASQGLQEDEDFGGIAKSTLVGAGAGAVGGAVIGGITGGVASVLRGRALRKQVLEGQLNSGEKVLPKVEAKTIQIAKQQGYDDVDIDFINTMKQPDKIKAQQMVALAEKVTKPGGKRILERPIDIVGEGAVEKIKFIQKQNTVSGKAVDTTAKALKGQVVDATPVRDKALSLLEDIGVTSNKNGTPNWSKSIFKKTPELEKKIMKALSDLPAGEMDAYDLHNFKKSIDEVVDYGVGGEGLKGKSASILKAIRSSADEVLDTTFETYNKANTDYKATRDVLDFADELLGKNKSLTKQRAGGLLRAVFSNRDKRGDVMKLVEQLDKTAKQYGGKFDDNLIDQALFTEILEEVYGTQATTSLQGQTARAIRGVSKVIEGIKNPLVGAAHIAEHSMGVSDENKKKILQSLLKL